MEVLLAERQSLLQERLDHGVRAVLRILEEVRDHDAARDLLLRRADRLRGRSRRECSTFAAFSAIRYFVDTHVKP